MICNWGTRRQYIGQPYRRLKMLNVGSKVRWIVTLPGTPWCLEPARRYSDGVVYNGTLRFCVCVCVCVDCVWNVMAYAQKPDFVFRRNGRVRLNRQGRQFSRLLAAELCASAVVILDTLCSEVVWRVLATHSIRPFPLHFPLPCVTVCHYISTGL